MKPAERIQIRQTQMVTAGMDLIINLIQIIAVLILEVVLAQITIRIIHQILTNNKVKLFKQWRT